MLQNKRRSFSRKFSSSVAGDFTASGTVSPQKVTPTTDKTAVSSDLPETPETAQQLPTPPTPAVEPKVKVQEPPRQEMAPNKEDVLLSKHAERVLVVGKGVVLTANVTSCDKVVVEGQFQGNIKTGTFVLSEGGQMEGEVRCADGCIGGNMKATIIASKTLLIGKAAIVTGDMVYDSLQVMDGGRLQGKLTHYSAQEKVSKPVVADANANGA